MIRIGIIGCAEIAYRRFMPAAKQVDSVKIVGVAEEYAPEKLDTFCKTYDIEQMRSYEDLITRNDIDAVYIPQPPAFHYKWAKKALEAGKHVLIEKPSTTSYDESKALVDIANDRNLTIHENYMFQYHSQIKEIKDILSSGLIGDIRLIRGDFGFPLREKNDFRYVKGLGGGALLDAGGYTIKLATLFLGKNIRLLHSFSSSLEGYEVDMYGSLMLTNEDNMVYQASYGMDNSYRCSLNIWGNKGELTTNRIFTAPFDFEPEIIIKTEDGVKTVRCKKDDSFRHSIESFVHEIDNHAARKEMYSQILLQAKLVDEVKDEFRI